MSTNAVDNLRQGHEAFSRHDLAATTAHMRPDVVVHIHNRGQTLTSAEAFRGYLGQQAAMSSDSRIADATYIDAGSHVIAQFRVVGTQDGPLLHFPPSNRPFALDVCEVWRHDDDGRAVEGHSYTDTMGLLIQLGHIPAPAMA